MKAVAFVFALALTFTLQALEFSDYNSLFDQTTKKGVTEYLKYSCTFRIIEKLENSNYYSYQNFSKGFEKNHYSNDGLTVVSESHWKSDNESEETKKKGVFYPSYTSYTTTKYRFESKNRMRVLTESIDYHEGDPAPQLFSRDRLLEMQNGQKVILVTTDIDHQGESKTTYGDHFLRSNFSLDKDGKNGFSYNRALEQDEFSVDELLNEEICLYSEISKEEFHQSTR